MWITKRRSAARPRPPMAFEALEARFLLATTGATGPTTDTSPLDGSSTTQSTTSRTLSTISRIDNYDLPASAGFPEVQFQIQWGVADPTQGTTLQGLLIVLPDNGAPVSEYWLDPNLLGWTATVATGPNLDGPADSLGIRLRINPAPTGDGPTATGTYDLSITWLTPAAPASTAVGGLDGGATTNPKPNVPSSISVVGKALPSSDALAPVAWLSQAAPGQLPPTGSYAATPSPVVFAPANQVTTPQAIPPVTLPVGVTTPGASIGVSSIGAVPTGPMILLPATSPAGTPVAPHGEARPSSPGLPGDGFGPPLIIGPLPLGRSEPDGGIFARSFSSTAGPAGSESLVAVAMPSGVGQSGSMAPPWSGALGRSISGHWVTPDGGDQAPSGPSTMRPVPASPSPLAASDGGTPRREGVVLLPSIAVAGGETAADSPATEAALGTLPPVLAFAVRSDSPDARPAGPALPPPPPAPGSREDADQPRDWRWGWPAVTIMALVGSAVMIFRLHSTRRGVGHTD